MSFDAFVGQSHIIRELSFILPELRNGKNENLLFRGPSGYGKTKLILMCASYLGGDKAEYLIPQEEVVQLNFRFRIHLIDEVHLIKNPEFLYPLMDRKDNIFILATNEAAELKEPLVNRCISFYFEEYTNEELLDIAGSQVDLEKPLLQEIVNNCLGNPRILKDSLCPRLKFIFKLIPHPTTPEGIKWYINNILGIHNGLNGLHMAYIYYISRVKTASLDNISAYCKIDKATIKREIEPILLSRGMIKISSKGRVYNVPQT